MFMPNATVSQIIWNIALSAICWSALYQILIRTKWRQLSPEFYSRIVSTLHGLIVVVLAFVCQWQGPNAYKYPGEANTSLHDITMVISLGYFLYDLCWCLYNYQNEQGIMIIHHIVSAISIAVTLFERASGAEAVAAILTLELTNPLLQLRWFLLQTGYNQTRIHTVVDCSFLILFLVVRFGFGTALMYSILYSERVRRDLKFCALIIYIISIVFVYNIVQIAKSTYSGKKLVSD